mgnify:CR=1 FL=1
MTTYNETRKRLGLTEREITMSQTTTKWCHLVHHGANCSGCRITELEASHQALVDALQRLLDEHGVDGGEQCCCETCQNAETVLRGAE